MAGETTITVIGRLTADPELRYSAQGQAVANFVIATNSRHFDKAAREWATDEAAFLRCALWARGGNDDVERLAATFGKADRVIASLTMRPNNYEKDGVKINGVKWDVEEIGPTHRFMSYTIHRPER